MTLTDLPTTVHTNSDNEKATTMAERSFLPQNRSSVVKSSDMSEEMQKEALAVAHDAMNKFRLEKDMATFIKEEFDKKYSPSWHCVVGRNFGSYVTHETNHFIYFYIQHIAIMLFKTGF